MATPCNCVISRALTVIVSGGPAPRRAGRLHVERSARLPPAILHRGAHAADRARGRSRCQSHSCAVRGWGAADGKVPPNRAISEPHRPSADRGTGFRKPLQIERTLPHMTSPSPEVRVPLTGIWLSAEPIQTPIDTRVIAMLAASLASRALREAELEELRRGVKLADVALEYLGLRTISVDGDGDP